MLKRTGACILGVRHSAVKSSFALETAQAGELAMLALWNAVVVDIAFSAWCDGGKKRVRLVQTSSHPGLQGTYSGIL
jgi:hypothetical protein